MATFTDKEDRIQNIVLKSLRNNLLKCMHEQNDLRDNVIECVFEYEIIDDYIVAIAYLVNTNECFNHIYRFAVTSKYSSQYLYFDGNVISGKSYNLETVKEKCKGYFNSYAKDFNRLFTQKS